MSEAPPSDPRGRGGGAFDGRGVVEIVPPSDVRVSLAPEA